GNIWKNISCRTALCAKPAATAAAEANQRTVFSKTRYVVEQSFGTLHRKFRYARAAYFGLIKVSAQSHLKAMCLNLLKAANRLSAPAAA
ncbi:transposase DDE domain protein, partial [Neisseria meningitidis 2001068]